MSANRPRVLIVEREQPITELFKDMLARYGIDATVFSDHSQALANYKPGYYDGLIIGLRVTSIYGFELARQIWGINPTEKICFTSGLCADTVKEVLEQTQPSWKYSYIPWLITASDLISIVSKHFEI